jgi:hypothetical protein
MRLAIIAILGACTQSAVAQDIFGRTPPPLQVTPPEIRSRGTPRAAAAPGIVAIAPDGVLSVVRPVDVPPGRDRAVGWVRDDSRRLEPGKRGTMVLDDGQRLVGELLLSDDRAAWQPNWLEQRTIDPSSTRFIVLQGEDPPVAELEDVVHLRNGDQASGIIQSVGGSGIVVETGSGESRSTATIPWDAVRAVAFVAPSKPRTGVRVWLDDGSVVDGTSIDWEGPSDAVLVGPRSPDAGKVRLEREWIVAAELVPGAIRPLSALIGESSIPDGEDALRYAVAAPKPDRGTWAFDAAPLVMEGPVRVACASPGAPARLLATVRRADRAARAGALTFIVRSGGAEVVRHRMATGDASFELRADLADAPFELVMLSDDGSIAGDCVELRRAVVVSAGRQP